MPHSDPDPDLLPLARRAVSVLAEPPKTWLRGETLCFGADLRLEPWGRSRSRFYLMELQGGEWIIVSHANPAEFLLPEVVARLARRAALRAMEENDNA